MRVIGYTEPGALERDDALASFEVDRPTASGHDVLVEIAAVSVNPVDYKVRMGRPPLDDGPAVLGWDGVGTVVEVGDQVGRLEVGDEVWYAGDVTRRGTNAEFHLVDERIVGHKPKTITNAQAAALPLTSLTAWEMLFDRLKVNDPVPGGGRTLLLIGGAGGVGSITIQLARALTDLTVIATASRPETSAWATELGAQHVINHREPLAPQIEGLGVSAPEFVFSTTHTDEYASQIAEIIAPQGRFGLIDDPPSLDVMPFKGKSVSIHNELMFTRSMFGTTDIVRQAEILDEVASLIDAGTLRSTATETLGAINVENLRAAHALLETGTARGKLVLDGFEA